jgi:hypothetical protein
MENVLEEKLNVNELIVQALEILKPETTVKELINLIKNDDIDFAQMISSFNE